MHINPRTHFLTQLFQACNDQQVSYVVMRNYEGLPHQVGNDIDILVDPRHQQRMEQIITAIANSSGWRIHNRVPFACTALYLFHEQSLAQVHFDIFKRITWHCFEWLDAGSVLEKRRRFKDFYVPDPIHEAVISFMVRLVYPVPMRADYQDSIIDQLCTSPAGVHSVLAGAVGKPAACQIAESLALGPLTKAQVLDLRSKARRQVLLHNLRRPLRLIRSIGQDVCRIVQRLRHPPGVTLALVGPDGCGKSSVAKALQARLAVSFYPSRGLHAHWKPVRPRAVEAPAVVNPHGQPVRSPLLSLLFFGYHLIPFFWGWWTVVLAARFRNGLVMIDRHYYDFFIDQRRYRLRLPNSLVRWTYKWIPKPELVVGLDAPPAVLQSRKQEVDFQECERQQQAYRQMVEALPNGHVMDGARSLDDVSREVTARLLDYLAERQKTRHPVGGLIDCA
jgi:thymidylate kinase